MVHGMHAFTSSPEILSDVLHVSWTGRKQQGGPLARDRRHEILPQTRSELHQRQPNLRESGLGVLRGCQSSVGPSLSEETFLGGSAANPRDP